MGRGGSRGRGPRPRWRRAACRCPSLLARTRQARRAGRARGGRCRPSRGVSSGTDSSTTSCSTSPRSSWAAPSAPGVVDGSRFRADRRCARLSRSSRPRWSAPTSDWRPMFTGIVEERGSVRSMQDHRHRGGTAASCPPTATSARRSPSTASASRWWRNDGASLAFDLSEETIARTSLRRLDAGHPVNLERPVTLASQAGRTHRAGPRRRGRRGRQTCSRDDAGGSRVRVQVPDDLLRYVVREGIDHRSTGSASPWQTLHADGVTVALIPHTLAVTTLGVAATWGPGEPGGRHDREVRGTPTGDLDGRTIVMSEQVHAAGRLDRAMFATIPEAVEDIRRRQDRPGGRRRRS